MKIDLLFPIILAIAQGGALLIYAISGRWMFALNYFGGLVITISLIVMSPSK